MLNFSRRFSELFDQLDPAHAGNASEPLREALLWLTTEARSTLELDLIEVLYDLWLSLFVCFLLFRVWGTLKVNACNACFVFWGQNCLFV